MEGLHAQGMCCGENTSSQIALSGKIPETGLRESGQWVEMPASL